MLWMQKGLWEAKRKRQPLRKLRKSENLKHVEIYYGVNRFLPLYLVYSENLCKLIGEIKYNDKSPFKDFNKPISTEFPCDSFGFQLESRLKRYFQGPKGTLLLD